MSTYTKDPDAVLDYAFNWSAWLDDGETITDFSVTAASGLTVLSDPAPAQASGVITYWLSGGTDESDYSVTCHIVTSAGREDDRTDTVRVRER